MSDTPKAPICPECSYPLGCKLYCGTCNAERVRWEREDTEVKAPTAKPWWRFWR
jgi:hypothetical protein